jgi:biotin carboxyl carrier protein
MSHIITTLHGQEHHIDTSSDEHLGTITLDEQEYSIDWKQLAPLATDAKGHVDVGGRYSLILKGKTYEVFARRITRADQKNGQTYEISIGGQRFEVKAEDERTKLLAGLIKGGDHSGEATIHAPMPGLVVGVLMEAGAEVKMGQPVIVLEAMKMENDLASPINGKIKEILVNKGQTVDLGDVLVVIGNDPKEE